MRRTLFAVTVALLLALPAACIHHHGQRGGSGGPGGPGCPKHANCECRCRHQKDCPQQPGGAQPDCPKGQQPCPQHQPPAK